MNAIHTKVFKSEDGWAVLLPQELGMDREMDVTIRRSGEALTVEPAPPSMRALVETLRTLPNPSRGWKRLPVDVPDRVRF